MSYPEDRVLIGVINRVRDLKIAQELNWYRIPEQQFPEGINTEYLGIFLSRAFGMKNGTVSYYAQVRGIELVYRRWILPMEKDHPRANERYYKLILGNLMPKLPVIHNTYGRRFAFISTTWERFSLAKTLPDLRVISDMPDHNSLSKAQINIQRTLPDDRLYC